MKKMIFVLLSLVMVFAFVSTAFAATTGNNTVSTWNAPGPTYAYPGVAAAQLRGGTAWSTGSPHQGYLSTTNKCEVCHSPHGAGSGGSSFKLLYGTTSSTGASGACLVCHVGSSLAIADVFDADASFTIRGGHDLGAVNAVPDSTWATAAATLGCSDCHSVHGAGAIDFSGEKTFILRAQPTWNGAAYTGTAKTSETGFCAACHDNNLATTTNGITHYMGAADAAGSTRGTTVLATAASTDCDNCHHAPKSTGTKAATTVAKWPHQSVSIVGLGVGSSASDVTDQDKMDDHCLVCHSAIGTSY